MAETSLILVEYSAETLRLLEIFATNTGTRATSPPLDSIIVNIAKTGQTCYPWELLKHLVAFKIDQGLERLFASKGFKSGDSNESYVQHKQEILKQLLEFPEAPFTIQRLCEIISEPEIKYTRTNSLLFAIEKMVSVTTVQRNLQSHEVSEYNRALMMSNSSSTTLNQQQQKRQSIEPKIVVVSSTKTSQSSSQNTNQLNPSSSVDANTVPMDVTQ